MIHDPHGIASQFIEEWFSSADSVTAHTSGSTGAPKEINLLKSDMELSAKATCRFFSIDSSSHLLLPLSPEYIAGKMMIVRALVSGARLTVEPPSSTPLHGSYGTIDLFPVVPSQLSALLHNPLLKNVRNLLVGGAPLTPAQEADIAESGITAYASYGMTETCSHVALRRINGATGSFTMLAGMTCTTDNRGCLVIEAPLFSFKRIVTNDIAIIENERQFRWLGRYDNVINSGGIKLHPEEIERRIGTIIKQPFYIVGRSSEKWGEEAVLYIEGIETPTEPLMDILRDRLSRYELPKAIVTVRSFERTPSGKIKRKLL